MDRTGIQHTFFDDLDVHIPFQILRIKQNTRFGDQRMELLDPIDHDPQCHMRYSVLITVIQLHRVIGEPLLIGLDDKILDLIFCVFGMHS